MKELKTNLDEVKIHKVSKEKDDQKSNDYWIFICNMSNWVVTQLKTRTGQVWNYNPPIGKTCQIHDYNACVNQKAYVQALVCQCTDASFGVILHLKHPKGYEGDSDVVTISPDCNYGGEVIGIDIPDPH